MEKYEKSEINVSGLLSNAINHPKEEMHWLFAYELFKTIIKI